MKNNYVTEFTSTFVSVMQRGGLGGYDLWGANYHLLLDKYNEIMRLADVPIPEKIKEAKIEFDKVLNETQQELRQVWIQFFPKQDYPEQNSIHGINIIINKILEKMKQEEAENLK